MRHVCPECGDEGGSGTCAKDGAVRAPVGADPLLGTMVGAWRVACLLGTGGMGRVYKAVQPEIGGRVAIKVLKRDAAGSEDLVERFFNEARAVNLIRHDAIVDVIDLGHLPDGAPYIVMEYLDGASLGTLFRRKQDLPLGTLARLVAEVLSALAIAHAKAIIHRDLKPDNVFVSPSGRVTVLDFGIAKLATLDGTTTQTGVLLGTPAYMAPEQARSEPVDARADLYAIGVILYEGAAGELPFSAASLYGLLDMHVKAAPVAPRAKNAAIPAPLEAVILRALAKDPDDRFASAAEMRAALLAAVEDLPDSAFAPLEMPRTSSPAVPSDPLAPTAASTQESLARGETMPSEQPRPRVAAESKPIQLSRRTAGLLAATALAGIGFALFVVLRDEDGPRERVVVVTADASAGLTADAAVVMADAAVVMADAAVPIDPAVPIDAVVNLVAPVDASVPVDARSRPIPTDPRSDRQVRAKAAPLPTGVDLPRGAKGLAIGNVKAFDPVKFYKVARQAAVEMSGGPNLRVTVMNFRGFDRSGKVDLTAGGYVEYQFKSDDRAKKGEDCVFLVQIQKGAGMIFSGRSSCSGGSMMPYCPLSELWTKAQAAASDVPFPEGATRANANRIGRTTWAFSIDGDPRFSVQLTDDCETSAAQ